MNIDFYKMRIDQVRDAANRSRWVLVASLVLAGALLIALWNALPFGLYELASGAWGAKGDYKVSDEITQIMKAELLKGWIQSLFISVPLLGIRFSVNDGSILGGLAFTVLAIWRFFSSRRENQLIGDLLIDASKEAKRVQTFVYHGIIGSQVFTSVTGNDDPIVSLSHAQDLTHDKARNSTFIQDLTRLLAYLPVVALLLSLITDIASIAWIRSAFRSNHETIGIAELDAGDYIAFVAGLILFFIVCHLSFRANQYQRGTQNLLRDARRKNWASIEPGPDPEPEA